MQIKGFIKNSFLDWDGKIASVLFIAGCNFRCPFCHNKDLVILEEARKLDDVIVKDVYSYLAENKKWIDAKKRFRLSDTHIQMARELGMNPKKFGSLANHKQEPWKAPLPDFIEDIYYKRFKKDKPGVGKKLN